MGWFEILMFYGFREGYVSSEDDEDTQLIPSLVEKTVLPLVTLLVEQVWDVTSSRQTRQLSQLVSRLMEDYPTVSMESGNTEVCPTVCLSVYIPFIRSGHDEDKVKLLFLIWDCVMLNCHSFRYC